MVMLITLTLLITCNTWVSRLRGGWGGADEQLRTRLEALASDGEQTSMFCRRERVKRERVKHTLASVAR